MERVCLDWHVEAMHSELSTKLHGFNPKENWSINLLDLLPKAFGLELDTTTISTALKPSCCHWRWLHIVMEIVLMTSLIPSDCHVILIAVWKTCTYWPVPLRYNNYWVAHVEQFTSFMLHQHSHIIPQYVFSWLKEFINLKMLLWSQFAGDCLESASLF